MCWSVELAGGAELKLGPPRQLWAKGRALEAVLDSPKIAEKLALAGYLDVSAPKQPTLGGFPGLRMPANRSLNRRSTLNYRVTPTLQ